MFNVFPSSTGMLFDSDKGVTACAPCGHTLELVAVPGRDIGRPPPPRAFPNYFGEPAGYSRSDSLPYVGSTYRDFLSAPGSSGGVGRGGYPRRTPGPDNGEASMRGHYSRLPATGHGGLAQDPRSGVLIAGPNDGSSNWYAPSYGGPLTTRVSTGEPFRLAALLPYAFGYGGARSGDPRSLSPPTHHAPDYSGSPPLPPPPTNRGGKGDGWGSNNRGHRQTLPRELLERAREHGFNPFTGRYYNGNPAASEQDKNKDLQEPKFQSKTEAESHLKPDGSSSIGY